MRYKEKYGQILSVLGIILVMAACASQQEQIQYSGSNLPAVIKYPETASGETETKEEKAAGKKVEEERLTQQPRISNLWEEADLRMVLQDISAQAGINIICDDMVEGTVTLEVKDMPLEKALKMVLEPGGYVFRRVDEDHYLVGSGIPGSLTALVLSQTETIITNRPAEEVATLLSPDLSSFVRTTKDGYSLCVTAPPEIIERIKKDLIVIDPPQPLIVIEVLVTEMKWSKGKSIGIDWSQILDFSASGGIDLERGAEWSYTGVLKASLTSSVQMLAEQGMLELKANPKIVTRHGQEAKINVTREEYAILYESMPRYIESPYYYYPRFEAKPIESGVMLKVKPRISREGEIILDLVAEVSDTDQASARGELPIVEKRGAETTVRVKSGETVVIGGLYQEVTQEVKRGVPILSRIPVLNFFFQRKKVEKQNTELVIFVTPKILKSS